MSVSRTKVALYHRKHPQATEDGELFHDNLQPPSAARPRSWITKILTKAAVDSMDPYKAGGPDEVKPVILQNLPDSGIELLQAIFEACIERSYTPRSWRTSRTVFIPKEGKKGLLGATVLPSNFSNLLSL